MDDGRRPGDIDIKRKLESTLDGYRDMEEVEVPRCPYCALDHPNSWPCEAAEQIEILEGLVRDLWDAYPKHLHKNRLEMQRRVEQVLK